MGEEGKFVIYGLGDSSGIRYVGVTSREPETRRRELLAAARSDGSRMTDAVRNWLRGCSERGEKPKISIIGNVSPDDALDAEKRAARQLREAGEPVLNEPQGYGHVGQLPQEIKTCQQCGRAFETRSRRAKYCSGRCQQASWRDAWGVVHKRRNLYVKTKSG